MYWNKQKKMNIAILLMAVVLVGATHAQLDRRQNSDENRAIPGGVGWNADQAPAAGIEVVNGAEAVAGEILLAFRPGAAAQAASVRKGLGATKIKVFSQIGVHHWRLPPGLGVAQAVQALSRNPNVQYAEANYILHIDNIPSDLRFDELWGLHNIGQTGGTEDADIDAPEAWEITTGSGAVVVGVIDTGVDYTHPDLVANMWANQAELNGTAGVDDDGNGYIDDIYGWDFYNDDNDPFDDNGHGTHCSGTIGAVGNNASGVVGVNWNVKIMALKFLSAGGGGSTADAIAAVDYATMMGAQLTSNSWGGGGFSQALKDAIQDSGQAGMLFIAAAGNGYTDTDANPHYPSSYDLDNIISVAATDHDDAKASFSNWGLTSVDLGAPGVNILSTTPGNNYGLKSGTSMATPHVAGVAALAWGIAESVGYPLIRDAIFAGVDPVGALDPSGSTPTVTGGRLNAYGTLQQVGMVVTGSNPAAGEIVSPTPPTVFVIAFSFPVDETTLNADDLTVNGTAADSVALTDTDTLTFTYTSGLGPLGSPVTDEGLQTMHMAAGAVATPSAVPSDPDLIEWNATFRWDITPMAVTSTDPTDDTLVTLPFTTLTVNFNEAYDPDSAGLDDLVLSQGSVVNAHTSGASSGVVVYTLQDILNEGTLTVEIPAGALTDTHHYPSSGTPGNPMLAYSGSFELDYGVVPFPTPLEAEAPLGSLIYDPAVSGSISPASDTDSFTIDIDPDQTVTVVVDPDSSLQPTVELFNPSSVSVGAASATTTGEDAVIQTVGPTSAGTYTLTVGSVGSTSTGAYTLQVILNAAVEEEGDTVEDPPIPQDIDASFIPLAGTAERGAVLGGIEDTGYLGPDGYGYEAGPDTPYFEDISATGTRITKLDGVDDGNVLLRKGGKASGFEFNFYGTSYNEKKIYVSSNGLITFGSGYSGYGNTDLGSSPGQAAIAPFWDDLVVQSSGNPGIFWEIKNSGDNQFMIIQWNEVRLYGSSEADTITFQAILHENGGNPYIQFNYKDLSGGHAGDEGASATVGIKDAGAQGANRLLVSYNEGPNQYVGTGLSTRIAVGIAPNVETPDYYAFSLAAGERATVVLESFGGNAQLDFQDSSGVSVGTTVSPSPSNVDVAIEFGGGAVGTYYAVVTGETRVQYNLVATRGSYFDLENNSGPEPWLGDPAQTIGLNSSAVVLGHVRGGGVGAVADASVLYYVDLAHGEDKFATAMVNLGITPILAGSFEEFATLLQAGGWDLAILMQQNWGDSSWVTAMTNYVNGGGRAIMTDWTRKNDAAAPFGGQWTNNNNGDPITQIAHPIWYGIADPFDLTNPGWGIFSMGLTATTGESIGTFPNGDDALVVGNDGRTLLNGFLSDTPKNAAEGVTIAENEIMFVMGPEVDFYEVILFEADVLELTTLTPADGIGEFVNELNPKIRLYDSSGSQVAADDDSAADGRNAQLMYPVPSGGTGTYYVEVLASDDPLVDPTAGEYVLAIEVSTGPPPPGITVNKTFVTTTEAGGSETFTVVLNTQPTADVTIGVSSSNTSEGTVSPEILTFDTSNWDLPQTVTVTGVDDFVQDGHVAYIIVTALAVSDDPEYNGLDADDVAVINLDDDTAGITVTPTEGLVTTEPGGTDMFTVVLNTQPTANVTIGISTSDDTEGLVSTPSQGPAVLVTLSFDATNWDAAQEVTVRGVDDTDVDGDIAYTIVTAPASSADSDYAGLDADDVAVTNLDDEVPPWLTITPNTMKAGTSGDVIIRGSGFQAGATVTFENGQGPAPTATDVIVVNDTTINATVSVHKKAKLLVWDVRVTNPDGSSTVLVGGFTVTP